MNQNQERLLTEAERQEIEGNMDWKRQIENNPTNGVSHGYDKSAYRFHVVSTTFEGGNLPSAEKIAERGKMNTAQYCQRELHEIKEAIYAYYRKKLVNT
jgi:hypothetical protein